MRDTTYKLFPVVLAALPVTLAQAQENSTDGDQAPQEVVVLGHGETRQVQSIASDQIAELPSGTSPLKAIENLPGVNFQSADPFGANAGFKSIRSENSIETLVASSASDLKSGSIEAKKGFLPQVGVNRRRAQAPFQIRAGLRR